MRISGKKLCNSLKREFAATLPPVPYPLQILFAALLGVSFGSFGTMLLYRIPRGETFFGRSKCPQCGETLRWYDLIPVFSFLTLGGRCSHCGHAISWRYPFIEAVTALLFALVVAKHAMGPWVTLITLLLSGYSLLLIAFYDFETKRIPDVFVTVLFLAALLHQVCLLTEHPDIPLRAAFIGAAIPLAFFGGLWLLSHGGWIGSGDILLGAAMGLLLGFEMTFIALFFAYLMGAIAAFLLILLRLVDKDSTLAFGPFLASGTLLALLTGDAFLAQYQRLFF